MNLLNTISIIAGIIVSLLFFTTIMSDIFKNPKEVLFFEVPFGLIMCFLELPNVFSICFGFCSNIQKRTHNNKTIIAKSIFYIFGAILFVILIQLLHTMSTSNVFISLLIIGVGVLYIVNVIKSPSEDKKLKIPIATSLMSFSKIIDII